jgi:hypothetical protein
MLYADTDVAAIAAADGEAESGILARNSSQHGLTFHFRLSHCIYIVL